MPNTQLIRKRKWDWYRYTFWVWVANLILVVLSYLIPGLIYIAPVLFLAICACWASMIILCKTDDTHMGDAFADCDIWCLVAAGIAVVYVIVNTIGCESLLREGYPHLQNGRFYLYNKGIIREITKEEYNSLLIAVGRLYIGFILLFSTLSLVFHSGRKNANGV